MLENKYFGIILTVLAYEIGKWINKKLKNPIFNPLLLAILLIVGFLKISSIPYETYKIGGDFISFFIAPATVAMVLDLYVNIDLLKENFLPILVGVVLGSIFTIVLTIGISIFLNFDKDLIISLIPQSITTAIAVSLSEEYMGIGALTAIVVVIRGISGSVLAPFIVKIFKLEDPVAQGIAIGTASHAVGTSKARQMGRVQGGFSGLSIAIAGISTVLLMPFSIIIIEKLL